MSHQPVLTCVAITCFIATTVCRAGGGSIENAAYRLEVGATAKGVNAVLFDKTLNMHVADGPYVYRAERQPSNVEANGGHKPTNDVAPLSQLKNPTVTVDGQKLAIRGTLAGLELEQIFTLPADRPILEEQITVRNGTTAMISLSRFETGFTRQVAEPSGEVLPAVAEDRVVAVPFRHRATDPPNHFNDFSIHDLLTQPGGESWVNEYQAVTTIPSRHRWSEGWALVHGGHAFGVFSFCQENMVFSILSTIADGGRKLLRFGGAAMIQGEPAALTRIAPGQSIDLGTTRYQTVEGGHREATYAYRNMLDERGCRFPKDFNPPVHWEQLYDMSGAWNDRPKLYTKAKIEQQAAKGRDYRCEALYLDPGWDTGLGSFIWGEAWLGPRKPFIDEMQSKYGLKVSLHTPLASWMSHIQYAADWGPSAVPTYPKEAWRVAPAGDPLGRDLVPAVREGRRNLALLPTARANASSLYDNGKMTIHQTPHLNDGWYGNDASWVAARLPVWAEIDLGAEHEISEVRVSNDRLGRYADRAPTEFKVLAATSYNPDSQAADWRVVAERRSEPVLKETAIPFPATAARWIRIEILKTAAGDAPRLDEIEVYESKPAGPDAVAAFIEQVKRRERPLPPPNPQICLGSKQYLAEAEKRLLANCADGVVYLMFDGNWWNGGCNDPNHGHPVPYCKEDHMRANLDLARRIHAKYPKVIIEMHDMLCGGNPWRLTPIYYKYGLPGSFDDNWGFELMWSPLDDIKQGRGLALYYSNLGCNVPIYTHVNLACDNDQCLILWWFASTCRHLGIGGTHADPKIVKAQQEGMKWYRERDHFFKRGDFYGISEEIHLHALPDENAFTVNVFNLSPEKKTVSGTIDLKSLGLDPKLQYISAEGLGTVENGRYRLSVEMPAWGAKVAEVRKKK